MTRSCLIAAALLAFAGVALPAHGSSVLSGRVIAPDGAPVAGAAVSVGDAMTLTDAEGRFSLKGLASGSATVSVSAPSAELAGGEQRLALAADGENHVEIVLERLERVRESVVVTGSGRAATLSDAPVRTELISSAFVEKQVKTTLTEALTATIPGVRIETNCQNCGTNQVRINGLDTHYMYRDVIDVIEQTNGRLDVIMIEATHRTTERSQP